MSSVIDVATTTLDRPPVLDDTALLGHPRGLGLLFMVEMWERFSYYGMRALLVLYLVNYLHWGVGDASKLYGTYTALVYLTPLIGGYLADRLIGTRRSLVIGGIIIACGHFALAFESMPTFYLGLALIIIGTGFFKPNVSTMVGQIYRGDDNRRDSGFTIFYMGINLGAALAPLVCGYLGQNVGWRYGFAAAGVGMVLGLLTYLWGVNKYLPGIGLTRNDPNNAAAVGRRAGHDRSAPHPHAPRHHWSRHRRTGHHIPRQRWSGSAPSSASSAAPPSASPSSAPKAKNANASSPCSSSSSSSSSSGWRTNKPAAP